MVNVSVRANKNKKIVSKQQPLILLSGVFVCSNVTLPPPKGIDVLENHKL